ncbi:Ig-like domain-containing protein [Spongiivirga sp. MCCC 1A20706]|uniref:Ig-like domain-containing protein n=1 Tax=Spongiivirga sp. MCCC 1A20706 TaxID=3160963 RepID=UPI003977CC17
MIFFCLNLLFGCSNSSEKVAVDIRYDDQKAIGIDFKHGDDISDLSVYRNDNLKIAVLGDFTKSNGNISFTPIVPFSSGKEYVLYKEDQLISTFIIDTFSNESNKLLALYPATERVPENLLKIYLVFSQPMEEVGSALDHITVKNTTTNKEVDIFLDLQTELWNKEHTGLTLWLDPGRIKTGLVPNKQKGLPILKGNSYEVYIDKNWKAANGMPLDRNYTRRFIVGDRDTQKPDWNSWKLILPEANTQEPVVIKLNETLDAMLLQESFAFFNSQDVLIKGQYAISHDKNELIFTPDENWISGGYFIEIASKLEDLAGNNLNHLFDEPISQKGDSAESKSAFKKRRFSL